tara:strand:- start:117 stop:518 length:402 start_codon:yes stop_codon:yes gene_type:complete
VSLCEGPGRGKEPFDWRLAGWPGEHQFPESVTHKATDESRQVSDKIHFHREQISELLKKKPKSKLIQNVSNLEEQVAKLESRVAELERITKENFEALATAMPLIIKHIRRQDEGFKIRYSQEGGLRWDYDFDW